MNIAKIAADFKVRVAFSPADMSKPAAIREMIEKTLQTSGRLDILVNNAGIQHVAPLQDFPPEKWDAILAIDFSYHSVGASFDAREQVGPHHQYRVGGQPDNSMLSSDMAKPGHITSRVKK